MKLNINGKEIELDDEKLSEAIEKKSSFEFKDDELRKEITDLSLDSLTPLDALNRLHELKKKIDKDK